jgi:hypothetical protein
MTPSSSSLVRPSLLRFGTAVVALFALVSFPIDAQQSTLVPAGAAWKYLDNGSDQGTAWRAAAFNDSGWKSGLAELGYGDGDEATIVGYGPNSSAKFITTYFRRAFSVTNPSAYGALTLRVLRDDGAVVYLNGTEVFRTNMPTGTVTAATRASTALGNADETTYVTASVNPGLLVAGTNVLAVEIHQANPTSSDISFNLELAASTSVSVTRGPYLQLGTPSSTTVRWRTSAPVVGRVQYGQSVGANTWAAQESTATREHRIRLTGLLPNSTYYYSVGTSTTVLAGGDSTYFFVTPPVAGTATPTRIWVLGDSGTANSNVRAVRDAYYTFTGNRHTNLWLMLGDNAYTTGTDAEFQTAVFGMFPTMLRKSVLWPTLGNHDGYSADSASQTGPYYDIFTLPTAGEAGGLASGTEAYYSFDYGNIHFICLESFETNRSVGGPMLTWLQQDLASTTQPWVIAFFHHPPYSKGSHDSDVDIELREMRQNALPILENAGVDLVLSGHSHSYERSFLIDGHYGSSSTFTSSMKKNAGSGREDGSGAYRKPTYGIAAHEGAVYAVAGSSGQTSGGLLNHPAMFVSLNSLGSMVLDVNGSRLDAAFIDHTGARRDYFTIAKGTAVPTAPDVVLYPGRATVKAGTWQAVSDASAAGGVRMHQPDNGVPKIGAPAASPANYFDMSFYAVAGVPYHLWFRARADGDSYYNDSVWVQFSGSVDASNAPAWRIGSTSGVSMSLEECSGCGVRGWGWHDNGYGAGVRGAPVYFATSGVQTVRIQQREDGISIDQLLLSPSTYLTSSPGATKNDTVILPQSGGATVTTDEIVIHANTVSQIAGTWSRSTDASAADGIRLRNPDAGAAKRTTASAAPTSYFDKSFTVVAGKPYHLWVRLKADNNSYANDSVFVQFGRSQTSGGTPAWRIGSTDALPVSLEEGSGAGVLGWGWNDNSYGGLGAPIYFAASGTETVRVQVREDGASIDQIVLSAKQYLNTSPGALKNDTRIVPATVP